MANQERSDNLERTDSSIIKLRCEVNEISVEKGILVELPESAVPGILFGTQARKPGEKLDAIVYYQDDTRALLFDIDATLDIKSPQLIYPSGIVKSLLWIGSLGLFTVLAGLALSHDPTVKSILLGLSVFFVIVVLSCRLQCRTQPLISLSQYMSGASVPEIRTVLLEKVGRGESAQVWCYLSGKEGDHASYAQVTTYGSAESPWPLIALFGDSKASQLLSEAESSDVKQLRNGKIVLKNTIVVRNPKFKSQILLAWQNHMFTVHSTSARF